MKAPAFGQLTIFDVMQKGKKRFNVLIACEESQRVCAEFRKRGHNAFSCDIQECSGGRPEWHICGDCLPLVNGNCTFATQDGKTHEIAGKWDLIVAHPPCTFLTVTGNRWFSVAMYGEKAKERKKERKQLTSSCNSLMQTVKESQLKIRLVICQHTIASRTKLYSRGNSEIMHAKALVYG